MATLSPASAKARAMARPMPRLPPVTRTERLKGPPSLVEVVLDPTRCPYVCRSSREKLSGYGRVRRIERAQGHVPDPVDFLQKPSAETLKCRGRLLLPPDVPM